LGGAASSALHEDQPNDKEALVSGADHPPIVEPLSDANRLARLEIAESARNLVASYAAAVDAEDAGALAAIFAPDMELSTPHRHCPDRDAVLEFYRGTFARSRSPKRHFITNVAVDQSGGQPVASSYFVFVTAEEGQPLIGWGRYRDTFGWRDGRLVFVAKWIETELQVDVREGWAEALLALATP
jgi:ketosteroid isomerase-like protein